MWVPVAVMLAPNCCLRYSLDFVKDSGSDRECRCPRRDFWRADDRGQYPGGGQMFFTVFFSSPLSSFSSPFRSICPEMRRGIKLINVDHHSSLWPRANGQSIAACPPLTVGGTSTLTVYPSLPQLRG